MNNDMDTKALTIRLIKDSLISFKLISGLNALGFERQ
jgi:hypothetical protein